MNRCQPLYVELNARRINFRNSNGSPAVKYIIMTLAIACMIAPTSAFACGPYGARTSADWDLFSVQLQVDEMQADRTLQARKKRAAKRHYKRLQKRYVHFMKDGRLSPNEQKAWDRAVTRTSKALNRLLARKPATKKRAS